jgi:hypothetical protein
MQPKTLKILKLLEHEDVKRVLDEQIEKTTRKVLLEKDHTDAYNIFVRPFEKVFKAARLVGMDIGNSIRLILKSVFTWDREKLKRALDEYDDKRQKINAEWKPIMDEADKLIGGTDPLFKMAIMGPQNYFLLKGVKASIVGAKTVAEIFYGSNWETIVNKYTTTLNTDQNLTSMLQQQQKAQREQNKLLSKLTKLFIAEGANRPLNIVKEDISKMSDEEAVDGLVVATGIDRAFQNLLKEITSNRIETTREVLASAKEVRPTFAIFASKDIKSFEEAMKKAKQEGAQVDFSVLEKIKSQVEEKAKELLKADQAQAESKPGRKSTQTPSSEKPTNDAGESGKAMNQQEALKKAELAVFNSVKEETNIKLKEVLEDVLRELEIANDKIKIDESTIKEMEKSNDPVVKINLDVYKNFLREYNQFKKDYESQVG